MKGNQIASIDDDNFGELKFLKVLDVSKNGIQTVFQSIFEATSLRTLKLSSNRITELPEAFNLLPNLVNLDLDFNQIRALNNGLSLVKLSTLNMTNNKIDSISPTFIPNLVSLKSFFIESNTCVSAKFPSFKTIDEISMALETNCYQNFIKKTFCAFKTSKFGYSCQIVLDQSDNKAINLSDRQHVLKYTDSDVKHLSLKFKPLTTKMNIFHVKFTDLEVVDLWKASINAIKSIENCSKLKLLDLRLNNIQILPQNTFVNCKKLEKLILVKNEIAEVHEEVFAGLSEMKFLDLSLNLISILTPETFADLNKLESLVLSHNKLTNMDFLSSFGSLQTLKMNQNQIATLNFNVLATHSMLHELHLKSNEISNIIPANDVTLKRLSYLDLEGNKLEALDLSGIATEALEYLDISGNQIKLIHVNMTRLQKLKTVHAKGNGCIDTSFEVTDDIENFMPNCFQ